MDKDKMIDDIIAMLDAGVESGQGHINVKVDDNVSDETPEEFKAGKQVQNGPADCSMNSMACAVPTMILDDDDEFQK